MVKGFSENDVKNEDQIKDSKKEKKGIKKPKKEV